MPGDPEVHRSWRSWAPWKAECGNWLSCWGQKKDDTDSIQRVRTAIFWFFPDHENGGPTPIKQTNLEMAGFWKTGWTWSRHSESLVHGLCDFHSQDTMGQEFRTRDSMGRKFSIQPISERCINGVNGVYFSETLLSRSHHWGPPQGRRWLGWEPSWTTGRPGRYRKGPVSHSQEDLEFLF